MTQTLTWTYEYLPYILTKSDGTERELPHFRIHPADGDEIERYIAETNEDLPWELQEKHAQLISAAPELFEALEYFFNIMHDYSSSRRKGYVKHALETARAALSKAKGGRSV